MLQTPKTADLPATPVGGLQRDVISLNFGEKPGVRFQDGLGGSDRRRALEDKRWSPKATLAVSGGVSLLLWGAIGMAIFAFR
jgi:hypothetical protein